jgi:hypothetical protein
VSYYPEEQLIRNGFKTTRIPGVLPSLNLPVKSFTSFSNNVAERSTSSIEKRLSSSSSTTLITSSGPSSSWLGYKYKN